MARLLLNFPYDNPVGHVLEAMKYGLGFHVANPGLEVAVAVCETAPTELFTLCPGIADVYPIPLEPFAEAVPGSDVFSDLPRTVDFVVENNLMELEVARGRRDRHRFETRVLHYLEWSRREIRATQGRGTLFPARALPPGLNYAVDVPVRLTVPETAERAAAPWIECAAYPRIAVVLGGSSGRSHYPSLQSWRELLLAVLETYPQARTIVTGVSGSHGGRTGGPYSAEEVSRALSDRERVAIAYDIGIVPQVALLAHADLLIAPHTGFAFLASTVHTPWVAISGGNWPEWFFNHAPFYSVLPRDPGYPHQGAIDHDLADGHIPGMDSDAFRRRIPEILEAIAEVMRPEFTYQRALDRHRRRVAELGLSAARIPLEPGF